MSDEAQVDAAMRQAGEAFGSLDIVVNCAGFGAIAPLTELSAEKWQAVHAVTLNGELGGRGIRVVGIAPGLVTTPSTRPQLEDPATRALFLGVIPMKRPVEAEEIADAAVYLASDQARSINGHTVVIDGGSLTRGYPALLTGTKNHSTA